MRRGLTALLRRLALLVGRRSPVSDPWERLDVAPQPGHYGPGARPDFSWYFEGESTVAVGSLGELQAWLAGCSYTTDPDLFHEPDFWQHPRTFEQLRRGDCEDYALWAWRKLVELGYDADLVVGRCVQESRAGARDVVRHAWVVFRHGGAEYLFEPVHGDAAHAVRPLAEVRGHYLPEFGVGPDRRRFAFAGYLLYWKRPPAGRLTRMVGPSSRAVRGGRGSAG